MSQIIFKASDTYSELDDYFKTIKCSSIFLVCDAAFKFLKIKNYFEQVSNRLGIKVVKFDDFQPNPLYESVEKGVHLFKSSNCTAIVAVGGGSSMDVAKCIKLYSNMNDNENYLKQKIVPNQIPFLAVPTTAGTGSEATRYAVVYYEGAKQSVNHESCIPSAVLFDSSALKTLPDYQKKSTMLDALCHSIESYWSVNSNDESKKYSSEAIKTIFENLSGYLANEDAANENMLRAANLAGKAINITQTTAGHAMCYKLTSLYGISHGHAAALCVNKLWPFMVCNTDKCIDSRGKDYLENVFIELSKLMGCEKAIDATQAFSKLLEGLSLQFPGNIKDEDFDVLKTSVNPVRLKNNPVKLTEDEINILYHQILEK
ncbi:phosphonoacetaldehyde reductase [Treponema sp.]|uniref:phosphonoacetaldehyde reductase n=1 Tax=Treponema sp. TaxID=166 RepID=UPI0025CB8CEC|nr:phosphonoacetaldehyde reductase [Treponema sp.]MCR5218374.1 phosphonoacetaldehyde reductase [Treponema sp.]